MLNLFVCMFRCLLLTQSQLFSKNQTEAILKAYCASPIEMCEHENVVSRNANMVSIQSTIEIALDVSKIFAIVLYLESTHYVMKSKTFFVVMLRCCISPTPP